MIVASTKIAAARPKPNSCSAATRPATKPRNAATMMIAAAVMIKAGPLEPVRDGGRVVLPGVPALAHPRDEEDLVVHREPEEHREEEDRDPPLDLRHRVDVAEERVPGAVLEDEHEDPVARRRPRAGSAAPPSAEGARSGTPASGGCRSARGRRGRAMGSSSTPGGGSPPPAAARRPRARGRRRGTALPG